MSQNHPQDPGSQQPPPGYQPPQGSPQQGNPQPNYQQTDYQQPDYQQQSYQQPNYSPNDPQGPGAYPAQPYGQGYGAPVAVDPGRTLGIVGLILSFFTAVIGMVISIIAFRSSKKAGFKNTPALVGIIVGALGTVFAVIAIIATIALAGTVASQYAKICDELGPGTHRVGGVTYTCS